MTPLFLDGIVSALTSDTAFLVGVIGLAAIAFLTAAVMYWRYRAARSKVLDAELDANRVRDPEVEDGELVSLSPPDLRGHRFGNVGQVLSVWRYLRKRRKLLNKGYVQWYLLDDSFPEPKFVKPKGEGGGIPELTHDGTHYLFPRDVMLPDERQGLWTVVHRKGEADPVNLRSPNDLSVPTKTLTEYLQQRVSASPPGWLDSLGLSPNEMIQYAIALVIVLSLVGGFLNGGLGF